MKASSILNKFLSKYEVFGAAKDALSGDGLVREAFVRLSVFASDVTTGKSWEYYESEQGICVENNGETRVFFYDQYSDRANYIEVNTQSPDVRVRLGNSLNEAGYDYQVVMQMQKEGLEVERVRESMQEDILVEYGKPPTQVVIEAGKILEQMRKKFGTPRDVDIPKESRNEKGYQKLLMELKKLSSNLDKQFEYAVGNDAMPKYPYSAFNMQGDEYKQFKRDIAKNVARSHAHGMLFTLEGVGDSGLSISVHAPNGDVVGSLTMDSDFDTEYFERNMVLGDPIEVEVRGLPDISKMSQKGHVSDNFRQLVSEMRKDFALVSPISMPSDLVSDKDISDAVSEISFDVEHTGRIPLLLSGSHPDIMSAKLTYLLSQKYPEIVNEGIAMAVEHKAMELPIESDGLRLG